MTENCDCPSTAKHLTKREVDVLLLIVSDLPNADIATKLTVDVRTIESHVSSMLRKTGARTRVGLLSRCCLAGVIMPCELEWAWSGTRCVAPLGNPSG